MYRARRSLPTPLSPVMRTFAFEGAEARATRTASIIAELAQRISPAWKDEEWQVPCHATVLSIEAPAGMHARRRDGAPGATATSPIGTKRLCWRVLRWKSTQSECQPDLTIGPRQKPNENEQVASQRKIRHRGGVQLLWRCPD